MLQYSHPLGGRGVTTVAELETEVAEKLQRSCRAALLKVTQFVFNGFEHVNLQCQTIHND